MGLQSHGFLQLLQHTSVCVIQKPVLVPASLSLLGWKSRPSLISFIDEISIPIATNVATYTIRSFHDTSPTLGTCLPLIKQKYSICQTLNSITSPSFTIYSFPSVLMSPLFFASAKLPAATKSFQKITSARINLSLKSV